MKFRKPLGLILAATAIMAAAPAFEVQAQTATPTSTPVAPIVKSALTCTLGKTNCTLLATAEANAASETSFLQSISFKMALTETGVSPINVQATGVGAFSIDPTVDMTDTNAVYRALLLQVSMTASSGSQNGKLSLLMKDGVFYAQDPVNRTWTGIDMLLLMRLLREQSGTSSTSNKALQDALQAFVIDPDVQKALAAIPNTPGWIVQQRLPVDAVLEGEKMAQIQYTYNPQALFRSAQVAILFKKFAGMLANNMPSSTQGLDQLKQISRLNLGQIQTLLTLLGGVLGKTNVKYIRWIGETDKQIHAINLVVNVNIIPSALSTPGSGTPPPPINGTINFSVQVTKIGQPVTLTTPNNATILSQTELEKLLGIHSGAISS